MKYSAKHDPQYDDVDFDAVGIMQAYDDLKKSKKYATSVSLPENVVLDLKTIAKKKSMPYQVLMRMLIVEGLEKMKEVA